MKRKILLFLILLPCFSLTWGQVQLNPTVISSAGGYAEATDINLAWTLGELAVSTLSTTDMILTQGFQQPFLLDIGDAIDDPEFNWSVNAYPNPVTDGKLNIESAEKIHHILVYNVFGQSIIEHEYNGVFSLSIETSELTSGIYFIKVGFDNQSYLIKKIINQ